MSATKTIGMVTSLFLLFFMAFLIFHYASCVLISLAMDDDIKVTWLKFLFNNNNTNNSNLI